MKLNPRHRIRQRANVALLTAVVEWSESVPEELTLAEETAIVAEVLSGFLHRSLKILSHEQVNQEREDTRLAELVAAAERHPASEGVAPFAELIAFLKEKEGE